MNRIRLIISAIVLSTMPIVSGCAALNTITDLSTTPVCTQTVADDKARWAAEALYNVPASAYRSANERDLFEGHDALKANVKSKLQTLGGYLKGVRAAHEVCDTATLLSYKAGMEKISAEVLPLIPR